LKHSDLSSPCFIQYGQKFEEEEEKYCEKDNNPIVARGVGFECANLETLEEDEHS
jgi:hypothetical protein